MKWYDDQEGMFYNHPLYFFAEHIAICSYYSHGAMKSVKQTQTIGNCETALK